MGGGGPSLRRASARRARPADREHQPVEPPQHRHPPGRRRLRVVTTADASATWHDFAVTSSAVSAQRLRDLAMLRRVRDRIDREYAYPLDVDALARGAHMSAGHLSREFRRAYGEP